MFHWQILLGLAGGIVGAIWGAGTSGDVFILLAGLAARVIGTCAVFYTLFLCRMLGAGDIKLMALCTGLLGMGPGLLVIFTGLFLAALRAAGMIWRQGSLWMRMDRIVIGEVRGQEAVDLLQAMNTGHDGSFCTGHANSCRDMLARLETMVLMGMELPLPAIRSQIASALDVMVHVARMRDRSRKVTAIEEVVGIENGEIVLRPLFSLDGEVELRKAGDLRCQEKLRRAGYGL